MQDIDETRTLSIEARSAMQKAFDAATKQDKDGDYIDHWYRMDVLEVSQGQDPELAIHSMALKFSDE